MSDEPGSAIDPQLFEESLRTLAEEFFFGPPQSDDRTSGKTSKAADEEPRKSGLTFRPFMLAGSHPQTCIIAIFHDEAQPELFGYKWPIWEIYHTGKSVRDMAVYFHAHLCELIGAYYTGHLTRHTEGPSETGAFSAERITWLSFNGSW